MQTAILTLTTDFGSEGLYVAAVKGVVLGLASHTQLVDVTHAISPQNILEGAFILSGSSTSSRRGRSTWRWLTPGSGPTAA